MGGRRRSQVALRAVLLLALVIAPALSLVPPSAGTSKAREPLAVHDPILIEGDADFTAANGVRSGAGTPIDPYIIEDWDIAGGAGHGIFVNNTQASFVIRNVTVRDRSPPPGDTWVAGINWQNVSNARLESSTIVSTYVGVRVVFGSNLWVVGNEIRNHSVAGIVFSFARDILVAGNEVHDNDLGIEIEVPQPDPARVTRNNVTGNRIGVYLWYASGVVVSRNRFADNREAQGFEDSGGPRDWINAWDEGYPVGGNSWSDYSGWDDCSGPSQDVCPDPDGLGDVPYPISGETGAVDRYPIIATSPPNAPPVASFGYYGTLYAGAEVWFDAESSYDPEGYPLSYAWNFGDGTGSGPLTSPGVGHVYAQPGLFQVALTVTDVRRANSTVWGEVRVEPPPGPEPLVLRPYEHPTAGFRLPIPVGWEVNEDVTYEGATVELILLGPVSGSGQSNIIVDTDEDPSVRETDSYLLATVDGLVAGLREGNPNSVEIVEGPTLRPIGGHAAVTFKLQHSTGVAFQKIAIVVSEPHRRYWVLILTTDGPSYPVLDEGFERMLDGFEITRAPSATVPERTSLGAPAFLFWLLGGIAAAVVLVIVAIVVSARRRPPIPVVPRAAVPPPALPDPPPQSGSTPWQAPTFPAGTSPPVASVRFCPRCGASTAEGASFCGRCGGSLSQ